MCVCACVRVCVCVCGTVDPIQVMMFTSRLPKVWKILFHSKTMLDRQRCLWTLVLILVQYEASREMCPKDNTKWALFCSVERCPERERKVIVT